MLDSFRDFMTLFERKEPKTGRPCRVIGSYSRLQTRRSVRPLPSSPRIRPNTLGLADLMLRRALPRSANFLLGESVDVFDTVTGYPVHARRIEAFRVPWGARAWAAVSRFEMSTL